MQLPQLCLRRIASCGRMQMSNASRRENRFQKGHTREPLVGQISGPPAFLQPARVSMPRFGPLSRKCSLTERWRRTFRPTAVKSKRSRQKPGLKKRTSTLLRESGLRAMSWSTRCQGRCFYQEGRLQLCCVWPRRLRAKGAATLKTRGTTGEVRQRGLFDRGVPPAVRS